MVQVDGLKILPLGTEEFDPLAQLIEDELSEIAQGIPADEWDKLPADLTADLDHYVYGNAEKMKKVFVDTLYWIAIACPRDPWQSASREAKGRIGQAILVTTDEVLTEFLTALARGGPQLRKAAVQMVRKIVANPNV